MKTFLRTILSILKELADENAYARHLKIHNRNHSNQEYRLFQDERLNSKYQKAKCC